MATATARLSWLCRARRPAALRAAVYAIAAHARMTHAQRRLEGEGLRAGGRASPELLLQTRACMHEMLVLATPYDKTGIDRTVQTSAESEGWLWARMS
eukprot:6202022-Pleurochrysis_carterae.AAC.1